MKKIKWVDLTLWIVAILVSLAIGGSFVDGSFLQTTILEIFPLIIHQLAGWIIIVSTIIGAITKVMKWF